MYRPIRRSRGRVAGAFLVVATAAALLHSSPVAATDDPNRSADFGHRAVEFLREHRAWQADAPDAPAGFSTTASSLRAGPTADAGGRFEATAFCTDATYFDAADAPHLDGEAYALDYDCEDRAYVAGVITYDLWVQDELDFYALIVDTDNNAANGCNGGDYSLFAWWDPTAGLVGNAMRTPSCDDAGWVDRGDVYVGRADAVDYIGMAFTADQIGSPSVSRWFQGLSGLFNPGVDFLPDLGVHTLTVPGGSPAPPAGTPVSGAAAQTVFGFGPATNYGPTGTKVLNAPLVGIAPTASGGGYWLLGGDGGIFSYGDAAFRGSTGGQRLNQPIVSLSGDPKGRGYWFVAADGGIFSFGVPFYGSTGGRVLNKPVVGMAATKSGAGYWLVASDGGIFSFGDARFHGSTGGMVLNQPIVGMAADPDGEGYWFVAADGGIFSFAAPFHGSPVGRLAAGDRVVSMAASPAGGYWVTTVQGAVYQFGAAAQHGQATGQGRDIAAVAAHPTNGGYWLLAAT